jgi:hypothetical protein
MNIANPPGSAETDKSSEMNVGENIHAPANAQDDENSANDLGNLLSRVSESSIREIGDLIDELERLRKKLKTDGDRIRRDVEAYAELSRRVMQLTSIISDSVKRLPAAPGIGR